MARYINADEALRISKEGRFMWAYDLTDLEEFLTNVPSVDAVEVVRCKDCAKCELKVGGGYLCSRISFKWSGLMCGAVEVKAGDFCSYGVKKEVQDG